LLSAWARRCPIFANLPAKTTAAYSLRVIVARIWRNSDGGWASNSAES